MTQQIINIGSAPNDGTGDPARTAFDKSNQNFTELYQVSRPTGNTIEYQFNNTITEPPSTGQIRFNQATQSSTTKIWASHTTSSGINIKQFLAAATTGAKLVLQDKIDNTNYIKFDVTGVPVDKTTYWEFAVAVTASGGNLPNAAILAAVTAASGGTSSKILLNDYRPVGIVSQVIPVASLAGYDVIEIEFAITPNAASGFIIQYSFDGGATYYNAAGYHMAATLSYVNIGTGAYSGQLGWPGSSVQFMYLFPGLDAGRWGFGTARVLGINTPGSVYRPWLFNSYSSAAGFTYIMNGSAACMGNATQPTHIRICSVDLVTTFAAGSFIKVYGLK